MIQIQNPSGIHYTIMCVLIDVFVLLCSFVIICLLYIFVVVVFFFVADTLYRLCLLCMPSIVVNLIIIIIIIIIIIKSKSKVKATKIMPIQRSRVKASNPQSKSAEISSLSHRKKVGIEKALSHRSKQNFGRSRL